MFRPLLAMLLTATLLHATPAQIEFFESKIRPILAQECYECHSVATKKKGGLLLDSRAGWQAGGDSGAVIKTGDPAASLLMQTIKQKMRTELPRIYSQELLNNLFRHPYSKIEFVMDDLQVTRKTAAKYLNRLADVGILSKHKISKEN